MIPAIPLLFLKPPGFSGMIKTISTLNSLQTILGLPFVDSLRPIFAVLPF
jgi:hypothetical protein